MKKILDLTAEVCVFMNDRYLLQILVFHHFDSVKKAGRGPL